jgi:probable rRNA maturation factor
VALTSPQIDISGDPSEVLCTQEEAISWFSSLKGEYEESISKLGRCSFNLVFLTKAEIQDMNKRFAGKDKPTNVLSFPSSEDLTEESFLGDIAICSELIAEEAISQGKETQDHLIHIFVHGVLHLLGFDHEEHTSAEQMESLEIRILEKIGVADPY